MSKIKWYEDEEQKEFVLNRFKEELNIRACWVIQAHEHISSLRKNGKNNEQLIIKEAMDLISNAVVMDRITDKNAIGARDHEVSRVKKRVALIRDKWPNLPEKPPEGLRKVRNAYEHFDAKLDDWATKSKRQFILDSSVLNTNTELDYKELGIKRFESLRTLRGNTLYYCDSKVDLDQVVAWAAQIVYSIHR
ncbi:hypothetical protein NST66_11070 [Priestia sp. FSL W8-0524]|uniref:hypothetical protein n=1 Tax=Priestia sp. FSL W8-0524 TaxID=2954625 RepID=UPI0030F7896C